MKNLFLGLAFATSLVASAYSHGCQQRHNNRHAQPLMDIAPNWSVHFPKFNSFWGQDLLDDPWQMFDHIADDPFHIFKPLQQEAKPVERIQCKTSGADTPLNDVPMKSDATADSGLNMEHSSTKYDDWSEEAELLRRQEWEKKLQEDVQREQQRREEWYQKKMAKEREEQEQRERLLTQERQRQQELLKKQEEELIRREEQIRRKRQEMEDKLRREQKLEEKRREEAIRQEEERQRRVREAQRVHEDARQREVERQEQLRREQWLQEKKQEEQRRQMEDFRRQEEQRAEERLRILEEKQRVTQKQLEEKMRLQREKVRLEEERQQEELRRKREQWAEQQQGAKQHHFNSHSFHESSSSHYHSNPRSDGSEQVIFDMVLTGYYPADLSVRARDGILQIEGSHVCACKEDCFMREFERKATIPSGVDTRSLSASLDSEGNFKVTGVQYRYPVQQNDTEIPVFGIHLPQQMPPALKYCPEGKTTYKLAKIDPATGSTHRRNAYKFERRKSHTDDDGVTIEVAEDYA